LFYGQRREEEIVFRIEDVHHLCVSELEVLRHTT